MSWATTPSDPERDQAHDWRPALVRGERAAIRREVAIVRWPEDAAAIAELRAERRPRLLLVAADGSPPTISSSEEDWIRLPASDNDVRARTDALASGPSAFPATVELRSDGRLFFRGRWVSLSPTEHAMASVLIDHLDEVVDAATLANSIETGSLSPAAVRVHLTRLRKRLATLGLAVRVIRNRGYVLDVGPVPGEGTRPSRP